MNRPGLPVAWRVPVLVTGGFALVTGAYGGLLRLGVALPSPALADVHGPLMALGFVGTLIALERAVALGTRWSVLAPACSGAGGVVLVVTGPTFAGKLLLLVAPVVLLGIYRQLWRRQQTAALLAQAAGAFAWYAAALLWLAGFPIAEIVPWLATFLVATIAGERLELAFMAARRPDGWFLAALGALFCGATAATLWPATGYHLFGTGLLAMVAWLAVFDVARHTVRATGLPRYIAVGLLAGYVWLGLAGVLWAGAGSTVDGPGYDATLHAVFAGFVLSMIFVHAPVILPAVLRRALPYHRWLYGPLVLLHASLLARIGTDAWAARIGTGDAWAAEAVWRWSGVANVAAVLSFAVVAAVLAARAARGRQRTVAPAPRHHVVLP